MGACYRRCPRSDGPQGLALSGTETTAPLRLTAPEYREFQRISRLRTAPYAEIVRAKTLPRALRTSDRSNVAIARTLGCTDRTVRKMAELQPGGCIRQPLGQAGRRFFSPRFGRASPPSAAHCPAPRVNRLSRLSASELAAAHRLGHLASTLKRAARRADQIVAVSQLAAAH